MGAARSLCFAASLLFLAGCETMAPKQQPEPEPAPVPPQVEEKTDPLTCPEVPACECGDATPVPAPVCEPAAAPELAIFGAVEWVVLQPEGIRAKARLDTGATSSSIHATNIVEFERDGKTWVRFNFVPHDGESAGEQTVFEKKVVRRVRIKRHDAESQRRYVVSMRLVIGEVSEKVEVTLSDRSDFKYSVLIGRNFLTDNAMVDVSRQFAAGQ